MKTKIVVSVAVVIIASAAIYFYSPNTPHGEQFWKMVAEKRAERDLERIERKTRGQITPAANGWAYYRSDEQNLAFSYPSSWELTEKEFRGSHRMESVLLEGDGYSAEFTTSGKGFPIDLDTQVGTYVIDGAEVKMLRSGSLIGVGTFCGSWSVRIDSPVAPSDIADNLLASIRCLVDK